MRIDKRQNFEKKKRARSVGREEGEKVKRNLGCIKFGGEISSLRAKVT